MRRHSIQIEWTLLSHLLPEFPALQKGARFLEVLGTTGQQRFGVGTQAFWDSCSLLAVGCLEEVGWPGWELRGGRPSGAPTTRARPSGRRLRSRGLRSGHRGAVFEPVSSPRKLQGRSALRSRPPGQHPLVGGV